jgi:tRNA(fMet)-specific endonuclease VapC
VSFLIDSDTCSAHLKNVRRVTNRFVQYTGRLHISTITLGELTAWAMRAKASPKRLNTLRTLLSDVAVLVVDDAVAWKFGEINAQLLDSGRPTPAADLLIATTALVHGLTLVTHNTRDYAHVPGLSLADWLAP